jgi:hypothetical protein
VAIITRTAGAATMTAARRTKKPHPDEDSTRGAIVAGIDRPILRRSMLISLIQRPVKVNPLRFIFFTT